MNIRISAIPMRPEARPRVSIMVLLAITMGLSLGGANRLQAQESATAPPKSGVPAPVSTTIATPTAQPVASDSAAAKVQSASSDDYVIKPEDVLDMYVYDVPELSREYIVSSAGNVTVPLLPQPVPAAGLSPNQLARALEQSFRQAGSLSRPQITVTVKQSRRSAVTVEGAVKSPQVVPVIGRTQLLSILSQCGGLADDHGSTVTISRGALAMHDLAMEGGAATLTATVELKKLMDGNDPMSQFTVWPGDRVSVEHAGVFYVLGEVGHPGGYNLKSAQEQVTVLQALAIAGDVTFVAKKSKAFIIRKNPTAPSGRDEIALDIPHILARQSPDPILQSNDILYVPSSGGRRAIRTLSSVPGALAGAAAYSRF
jgi:polysaccharide biosynthesis/export protein